MSRCEDMYKIFGLLRREGCDN